MSTFKRVMVSRRNFENVKDKLNAEEKELVLNFIENSDAEIESPGVFDYKILKNTYGCSCAFKETKTPGVYNLIFSEPVLIDNFTVPGSVVVEGFFSNGNKITAQRTFDNIIEIKTYLAEDFETPALGVVDNTIISVKTYNSLAL